MGHFLLLRAAGQAICGGHFSRLTQRPGGHRLHQFKVRLSGAWRGNLVQNFSKIGRVVRRSIVMAKEPLCLFLSLSIYIYIYIFAVSRYCDRIERILQPDYTWAVGIGKIGNRVAIGAKICPIGPPPIESGRIGQKTNFGHWDRPPFGCRSDWLQSNRIRSAKKQISAIGIGPHLGADPTGSSRIESDRPKNKFRPLESAPIGSGSIGSIGIYLNARSTDVTDVTRT